MFINIILYIPKYLNCKWSLTSQPTKLPTLAYIIDGQAAKQKFLYIHRAGQFLIQTNSRSAGKEVSVLNGARRFINVFTRTYHWVISSIHSFYNINFNIILPLTSHIFRVCVTNVIHLILLNFMLLKCIIEFMQGMKCKKF
jgi:hypothetical protein